ncbi:hypothetical protein KP2612_003425 [Komagataella phaffii]
MQQCIIEVLENVNSTGRLRGKGTGKSCHVEKVVKVFTLYTGLLSKRIGFEIATRVARCVGFHSSSVGLSGIVQ